MNCISNIYKLHSKCYLEWIKCYQLSVKVHQWLFINDCDIHAFHTIFAIKEAAQKEKPKVGTNISNESKYVKMKR